MGQPTYVLYDPSKGEAFIQVRYRPHQAAADVAYLAPSLIESGRAASAWGRLLEGAGGEAAAQGIQRVFANLPSSGAEVESFKQAGFTLYAGEEIYRLAGSDSQAPRGPAPELRSQRAEDWPLLQRLCVAITPQRVRQAEGGIALGTGLGQPCQRYVLATEDGSDLRAAMMLCRGSLGHWLRLLVHPDSVDLADDLVRWALDVLAARAGEAVYCNVRQYEGGLQGALSAVGFEPFASRTLVVKHTVAWVKNPAAETVPALKSGAELAPPVYRIEGEAGRCLDTRCGAPRTNVALECGWIGAGYEAAGRPVWRREGSAFLGSWDR